MAAIGILNYNNCREITKLTRLVAAYWIAFGPHGPRALPPPGEGKTVFLYTLAGVVVSVTLFGFTRMFARPPPKTMTKEWQEATEEYLKVRILIHNSVSKVCTFGEVVRS